MSDDIVIRLREWADFDPDGTISPDLLAAAEEIEMLRGGVVADLPMSTNPEDINYVDLPDDECEDDGLYIDFGDWGRRP